jgi:hypothetical protein
MNKLALLSTATLMLGMMGCTTTEQEKDTTATPFEEGSGQEQMARPELGVHPGPYSFEMNGIVPPFKFYGYLNRGLIDATQVLHVSDFYNPTGVEVFADGHPLAGQPKPRALVMMMSAVWCQPCNYEAANVLPTEVPPYQPDVQFLGILIDGQTPGTPATITNLNNWTASYQLNTGVFYPMTIDPTSKVMSLYEPAFPGNMIIDTEDMRMVYRVAGVMDESFWLQVDKVLN